MRTIQTGITSQRQISVPAPVRQFLHLAPGSVLVWTQEGDRIVVERATRHSTAVVIPALLTQAPAGGGAAKTLDERKQGVRQHFRRRHAGG